MSTIKANTLLHSDGSTTNPPSIPALDKRMAKAWVVFNGTGTLAVLENYGVSSVTDNAVGQYYINFAVAQANANYAVICTSSNTVSNAGNADYAVSKTTSNCLARHYEAGTHRDSDNYQAVIFSS